MQRRYLMLYKGTGLILLARNEGHERHWIPTFVGMTYAKTKYHPDQVSDRLKARILNG